MSLNCMILSFSKWWPLLHIGESFVWVKTIYAFVWCQTQIISPQELGSLFHYFCRSVSTIILIKYNIILYCSKRNIVQGQAFKWHVRIDRFIPHWLIQLWHFSAMALLLWFLNPFLAGSVYTHFAYELQMSRSSGDSSCCPRAFLSGITTQQRDREPNAVPRNRKISPYRLLHCMDSHLL